MNKHLNRRLQLTYKLSRLLRSVNRRKMAAFRSGASTFRSGIAAPPSPASRRLPAAHPPASRYQGAKNRLCAAVCPWWRRWSAWWGNALQGRGRGDRRLLLSVGSGWGVDG